MKNLLCQPEPVLNVLFHSLQIYKHLLNKLYTYTSFFFWNSLSYERKDLVLTVT